MGHSDIFEKKMFKNKKINSDVNCSLLTRWLTFTSQITNYQSNHQYRHFIDTEWRWHASDRILWICLLWRCFRPVYELPRKRRIRRQWRRFLGGFRFLGTFLYPWKHQTFTNDTIGSVYRREMRKYECLIYKLKNDTELCQAYYKIVEL